MPPKDISVLFLVFNRPQKALAVFQQIRAAQPARLFIAADGPRADHPEDLPLCDETRSAIVNAIDWPCEVHTLFREGNQGCRLAVSSAITWFFHHVEEGIILEDDCLPDPTFFDFCGELLQRYRHEPRVMMISGDNFLPQRHLPHSYFFMRFTHIWGWATWRRAWARYDVAMRRWPAARQQRMLYRHFPRALAARTEKAFESAWKGQVTTWDLQWQFAVLDADGLSVTPSVNLVSNIDSSGTHMKIYDPGIHLGTKQASFPLRHPPEIRADAESERYTMRYFFLRSPYRSLLLMLHLLAKTCWRSPARLPSLLRRLASDIRSELGRRRSPISANDFGGPV